MPKTLPKNLTSYDLLKTFAVVFMIIDHAGYYLFPDDNWWRVAGRLCVPVWFFLIGYAKSRDLGPRMWIGAGILIAGSIVCGQYFLPFNILATMIAIRLVIDRLAQWILPRDILFMLFCAVCVALILPTNLILEYGTQGLLLAFFGYICRHKEEYGKSKDYVTYYGLFLLLAFIVPQFFIHGFEIEQFYALAAGSCAVFFMLYHFRPAEYPDAKVPGPLKMVLQFAGRHSLEIYVAHILLFEAIVLWQGDPRFGFLDWKFMPSFWG